MTGTGTAQLGGNSLGVAFEGATWSLRVKRTDLKSHGFHKLSGKSVGAAELAEFFPNASGLTFTKQAFDLPGAKPEFTATDGDFTATITDGSADRSADQVTEAFRALFTA